MAENRTQHTPEPWETRPHPTHGDIRDKHGCLLVTCPQAQREEWGHDAPFAGKTEARANAARIVACVNACAGIADTDVVKEMVKILREEKEFGVFIDADSIAAFLARIDGGE